MDEKFITEIKGMFASLHERMRQNLPFWENEVDTIIANRETDRNRIELTFDYRSSPLQDFFVDYRTQAARR